MSGECLCKMCCGKSGDGPGTTGHSPHSCHHPPQQVQSVAAVRSNSDPNPKAINREQLIDMYASTLKMELEDPSETFRIHGAITTKTLISIFTTANPK